MTCTECGAPLDPTVTHVQHDCCEAEEWTHDRPRRDDCDCPEVCADCCTDPDCPLREPQETP